MDAVASTGTRLEWIEEGRCARIVLDEGRGNVLDLAALERLRGVARELANERALRAVLLDAAGEHFSFGASVADHLPEKVGAMLGALHGLARELFALDVPLLAAVRGRCLGGGLELALLADRIVAAPGSLLGQPELLLGVFAPLGSLLLPRAVGTRRASDLLLSGRSLTADEALRWGLVAEVGEDPAEVQVAWYREHLAAKSAASLCFATRAARRAWLPRLLEELADLERLYLEELAPTHDATEGLVAFLEKRAPRWEDR